MRSDVFIAKFARGAVAASVAGAGMLPQNQSEAPPAPEAGHEDVCANVAAVPDETTEVGANQAMVLPAIPESPTTWGKKQEREFRRLALAEAEAAIAGPDKQRLEELTRWRNRLLHGQTAEEISWQLKRDRLIDRMESLLKEYVEFQKTANQKRSTA